MIIQNNFNKRSVDLNSDYKSVGKGSNSLDSKIDDINKNHFTEENPIIQNILDNDTEYDDTSEDDNKWSFFS